jgi:hypothetical protein
MRAHPVETECHKLERVPVQRADRALVAYEARERAEMLPSGAGA